MSNPDQLDIRELRPGVWRLEFPYNEEFIAWLKARISPRDRSYDPATHFWDVTGDSYLPAIEGVGVQRFHFVTKIFWRDGKEVWKNLKTGKEEIQESLFG